MEKKMTYDPKTIEQEIVAAEHARREATTRGDVDAMLAFIGDTFHYAHISGLIEDREQFIARSRKNPRGITFTSASNLAVQPRKGYALLTGKSRIESPTLKFDANFLSVWERGEGGWKMTAYASTPMLKGG